MLLLDRLLVVAKFLNSGIVLDLYKLLDEDNLAADFLCLMNGNTVIIRNSVIFDLRCH